MEPYVVGLARGALALRPYNLEWVQWFGNERDALLTHLPGLLADVEHVGRTAIPGLEAKPIIDMQRRSTPGSDPDRVIPRLVELGYTFVADPAAKSTFVRVLDAHP